MLFNSAVFLFAFLPITLVIYFRLCRLRWITAAQSWLVLASLFFYSYWNVAHLPLLRSAIRGKEWLTITYIDVSGAESHRDIRPLQLEFWGRVWTLAAWCEARADFRMQNSWFPAVPKPIIGAINGACAGLGMVYALYTDIRFASDAAMFTTAFSKRGLIAEHGISWLLPRLIGFAAAADLRLASAEAVFAVPAAKLGLAYPADAVQDFVRGLGSQRGREGERGRPANGNLSNIQLHVRSTCAGDETLHARASAHPAAAADPALPVRQRAAPVGGVSRAERVRGTREWLRTAKASLGAH